MRRLLTTLIICFASSTSLANNTPTLSPLRVIGPDLVDESDEVVLLRGVNLGNWLLLEPWMFGLNQSKDPGGFPDQASILRLLRDRFGEDRADELIDTYRANWVLPRDMEIIKSFGFNAIRLPIHYSLLEDDSRPMQLRPDAFKWIDRGVEMAADEGLYVILDLHGVPGGQSIDAPTGEIDRNELWTDSQAQSRTVWLWSKIAERYADHPSVAAYDVVNEPFGDFSTNISPIMKRLFGEIHDAIRNVDPDTLIYAPGTLQGIAFYGNPADMGWQNVGFTEHAYPGLFGWGEPTVSEHARFVAQWVGDRERLLDGWGVPFLIGEFNPVFDHVGGDALTRAYFDLYNNLGWGATMWAYKTVKARPGVEPSNWYLVTNDEPFPLNDLNTVDFNELQRRFEQLGSMPLAIDDPLRQRMTAESSDQSINLPRVVATFEAPETTVDGWTRTDVGDASTGGLEVGRGDHGEERWRLWGGGLDVFGRQDGFSYLHADASPDRGVWTVLHALRATDRYAKAGLMWRKDISEDAAHGFLHAFPDGRVVFATRDVRGGLTAEQTLSVSGLPVGLGMQQDGEEVVLSYTDSAGQWQTQRHPAPVESGGQIGLAVLAHDEAALSFGDFDPPTMQGPPAVRLADGSGENLLRNPSFEEPKAPTNAADEARDWNRWGAWLNREVSWTPARDGEAIMAYHHWRIDEPDNAGSWQDVTGLDDRARYTLTVHANVDRGDADEREGIADSVELRLEAPDAEGRMLRLGSRTYAAHELATGKDWSRLNVSAPSVGSTMRALIIVNPSDRSPRHGAIKFDEASLVKTPQQ